ncbi:hypothetical protein [Nodosilinea sp. P-1105]|uniref:hypothetical protein n=1 Tax=Nodosilinea sp. P-1105 TaxID=2546229 RepID=UPI00146A9D09|nr:hypothetical protein [Nodosilinea sp. P-1105]NMF82135.1 hypothetical protein [Nodosilinea sp. P-1105]
MAQHLKRWESPRRSGRNHKGRGGTARQRQLSKRQQTLRRRLRSTPDTNQHNPFPKESQGSPFVLRGLE